MLGVVHIPFPQVGGRGHLQLKSAVIAHYEELFSVARVSRGFGVIK